MAFQSTRKSRRHRIPRPEGPESEGPFFQPLQPAAPVQAKLTVGAPDDKYEREADAVANRVVSAGGATQTSAGGPAIQTMPDSRMEEDRAVQEKHDGTAGAGAQVQRATEAEEEPIQQQSAEEEEPVQQMSEEEEPVQAKSQRASPASPGLGARLRQRAGKGRPLAGAVQDKMETGFRRDFSGVHIHTDAAADEMNRELGARAFARGNDVYFRSGEYNPDTADGQRLLAHELTHTVQQGGGQSLTHGPDVQRTLGDGHDLTSPRFAKLLDLEAAYDKEKYIKKGSKGRGVQAIQQVLYDLGYSLPGSGADGDYGDETKAAVEAYQRHHFPAEDVDGVVGPQTMGALDARFGAVTLPAPARLTGPWDSACVLEILCPWSPHTVDVLRDRITLKSYDRIFWRDERWNGVDWEESIFEGAGYNTGTEIGVINDTCEAVAQTLYHEILHAEQPSTHETTLERENYAYRIEEEFNIAMGLKGQPNLRSTDAQGRSFADPAKVETDVSAAYPSVPTGGAPGEQILGKAATLGHVEVRRPNGSIYSRPAVVGEKVPAPTETTVNESVHDTSTWFCP
ncbi:MAG: DUF4157 domain-containing protein [Lewinella sp.]